MTVTWVCFVSPFLGSFFSFPLRAEYFEQSVKSIELRSKMLPCSETWDLCRFFPKGPFYFLRCMNFEATDTLWNVFQNVIFSWPICNYIILLLWFYPMCDKMSFGWSIHLLESSWEIPRCSSNEVLNGELKVTLNGNEASLYSLLLYICYILFALY
jgi:hypothetical protein